MATETIEGTWEEIVRRGANFVGRKVRLTVLDDEESPKPNKSMLEALQKVSERSNKMPVSSGVETLELLREARSGGMFGDGIEED